jgi:hypothetical protein
MRALRLPSADVTPAAISGRVLTHDLGPGLRKGTVLGARHVEALRRVPEVAEIRLSLPNRHHFVVDLSPFGLANDNEVFRAEDRPYGLIEAVLTRPDAPPPGPAWDPYPLVR